MDEIIQSVYEQLAGFLPEGWSRASVYADRFGGSSCVEFYIDKGNGKYLNCLADDSLDGEKVLAALDGIDGILSEYPVNTDEKKRWTALSLFILSDGKVSVLYDYDDHDDDYLAYQDNWVKKYITED